MEKLTTAQKKVANNELRAKLIIEANNLIKDSGLKKITLKKMRAEIDTGKILKLQKVVDDLNMAKNLDKSAKGITQAEIIKAKKLNRQHLKNIDAFNKNTLLKTINVLVPYANKSVKQLNLKAKGNKFVQVLIKQRMDKEEINKL